MDLDWISRHDFFERILREHPKGSNAIIEAMSPDDLLWGMKTGKSLHKRKIALPDKVYGTRQTKITEFFR
jgi:hypothetical protein